MQLKVGLRPGMVLVFPPGAPLRRGGVYPLKAGGAKRCAVLYGTERRGAPVRPSLPLPPPPHISPLVAKAKGVWSNATGE